MSNPQTAGKSQAHLEKLKDNYLNNFLTFPSFD